jgi:hypothetical protein
MLQAAVRHGRGAGQDRVVEGGAGGARLGDALECDAREREGGSGGPGGR